MNFFSSDLHFGSEQTIVADNRPFKNVKAFEKFVIKTWNKQTTKDDTIWVIGDFVSYNKHDRVSWEESIRIVKKFKAKINLLLGNNEERIIKNCFDSNFEEFRKYCIGVGFNDVFTTTYLEFKSHRFYLVHKPKHSVKDAINLFGHEHNAMGLYTPYGFNIGCDINHFRLHSEDDIMHLLEMKEKYWDKDDNFTFTLK